jgi:hypothetical protein
MISFFDEYTEIYPNFQLNFDYYNVRFKSQIN